ncbi:somatostatin receptor type 2 [Exaiptasia diaphana]|uniref:G-protein coupled receptors family 1 profile domain-containing protein n=1 Tax=Exaiptasia diaphana TaxID=2652724 RepID=A0A913Y7U7_EXADI|nr:somatostatin receptor type 2 [Exaiptasia diaphana]XP_020916180.1 somatostatin receptor type 2 [Exaiptasia diaphana]XP_020916182.1 somatostatin receptor type 2 [Exaiptasia diaphana]XP_020916183.1 somatostatin receptor type 2 [Exaiptasia diaphana]XP_020916184.1 somatostatin receptor type 2 [Exaiptasia diaphana]XP_028519308.1 somatostatin receptor type 2 [Exaiptasia diaphana]XP_028519309.1 somatostatin receptor type 2 [Exaiptasia diaphana]XP_028519310.1 somatostatin receptor type 2 [Exaiptas
MNNSTSAGDTTGRRDVYVGFTVVIFIFGLLGNTLVIAVLGKKKKRSIHEMFVLNLALADGLFLLLRLPLYVYEKYLTIYKTDAYCRIMILLHTIFYFISIFTITAMAIYRCYVIVNPYNRTKLTPKTGYRIIGFVWFASFIIVLPIAVVSVSKGTECDEKWFHSSHADIYTAALFVLQFLLPLSIIAVAYIKIGVFLVLHKAPQSSPGKNSKREKRRKENKQVIMTLAVIVILFTICLLPGQIAWMVDAFGSPDREKINVVYDASIILDFIHACVNPVIYALLTDSYRKGYKDVITKVISCGRASITPDLESSINMHPDHGSNENENKPTAQVTVDENINRSSAYNVPSSSQLDYKF